MKPKARARGLQWMDVTIDPNNAASIRVVEKVGGHLVEGFTRSASQGGGPDLLFRIPL